MTEKPLLTPEAVAERLGIAVVTAKLWMRRGDIPKVVKIGSRGLLRISEEDLAAYIKNSPKVAPKGESS